MNFSLYIAKRYLFSRKSHNAINIVTLISVCGVAVGTMALVCVLSVFNGFQTVIEGLFCSFDPQLKIEAVEGKVFNPAEIDSLIAGIEGIENTCDILQENALLQFRDKQMPVVVKGVPDNYTEVNDIKDILFRGEFTTRDRSFNTAVGGIGLVQNIGCAVHLVTPIYLYAPKREGKISMARPDESFRKERVFYAGSFMVKQEKYDNNMIIVSLDVARNLFGYDDEVSAKEIRLRQESNERKVKKRIQAVIGDRYRVLDRYEQQEDFFRMMQVEKWITYLILTFILMIAIFNIIGSLSMLMIEKKDDMAVLSSLGATRQMIFRSFLFEGTLISLTGVIAGIAIGLVLCWIQIEFGIISLGSGSGFIVNAYPVDVRISDLIIIFFTVTILGFAASIYPAKQCLKE